MALHSLQNLVHRLECQDAWSFYQQVQKILGAWPSLVGSMVSSRTRPLGIQKGTLQVAVCNSMWAQNLLFERQRLLKKINERFPDLQLTDIRFSTTQWHGEKARNQTNPDTNSDVLEVWRSHPSRFPALPKATSDRRLTVLPSQPDEAFQKWASLIQRRSQQLPSCPQCGCPTPLGELQRWRMCGICITHQWTSPKIRL